MVDIVIRSDDIHTYANTEYRKIEVLRTESLQRVDGYVTV